MFFNYIADLPGELESIDDVNEDDCLECARANPDMIVGMKIRLSANIANQGKHEAEALRYFLRQIMLFQNTCILL